MSTIKIRVAVDEWNNRHYFQNFEILDELPVVGSSYDGESVYQIREAVKDCEQGSNEACLAKCYQLYLTVDGFTPEGVAALEDEDDRDYYQDLFPNIAYVCIIPEEGEENESDDI